MTNVRGLLKICPVYGLDCFPFHFSLPTIHNEVLIQGVMTYIHVCRCSAKLYQEVILKIQFVILDVIDLKGKTVILTF